MSENQLLEQFTKACYATHDAKVKTRKEGIDEVSNLLDEPNLIRYLDNNPKEWVKGFTAIKTSLYKEMNKLQEQINKRGHEPLRSSAFPCDCRDLLTKIVKNANRENGVIAFTSYYDYVRKCNEDALFQKYCMETCLTVFGSHILDKDVYWDKLPLNIILDIKGILKNIHNKKPDSRAILAYIALLRKGFQYKLPLTTIKEETEFIRSFLSKVNASPRWPLEAGAQLVVIFSETSHRCYKQFCTTEGDELLYLILRFYNSTDNAHLFRNYLMDAIVAQLRAHDTCTEVNEKWKINLRFIERYLSSLMDTKDDAVVISNKDTIEYRDRFVEIAQKCYKHIKDVANRVEHIEPIAKKPRREAGIVEIFDNLHEYINGSCILLFALVFEKYPHLISVSYFEKLLSVFSNYVKDSKAIFIRGYVFRLLGTLLIVEEHHNLYSSEKPYLTQSEWMLVYESAVRAIGLNQNLNESHHLLQQLFIKKHSIISADYVAQLVNLYTSRTIQLNENSITTFHNCASYHGLKENTVDFKNAMLDLFIPTEEDEYCSCEQFSYQVTADAIVNLTFKHYSNNNSTLQTLNILNDECFKHLVSKLIKLQEINVGNENYCTLLRTVHLFTCLLFYYTKHNVAIGELKHIVIPFISSTWSKIIPLCQTLGNDDSLTNVETHATFRHLVDVMKLDENMGIVKETIDMPFIEALIDGQCNLGEICHTMNQPGTKLKLLIIEFLISYSNRAENDTQKMIQYVLFEFEDFDPWNSVEYHQAMMILGGLKNRNCLLYTNCITAIAELIKVICLRRFQEYNVCVDVLRVLENAYRHLIKLEDLADDVKNEFIVILYTIHQARKKFGENVELGLLNCFHVLINPDICWNWASYNDKLVVYYLPDYLESRSLAVKQQAMKIISLLYQYPSRSSEIEAHKIKIWKKILHKLDETYQNLSQTDDDEVDNFNKLVVEMFSSIVISARGTKFTKRALCELLIKGRNYAIPNDTIQSEIGKLKQENMDISAYINMILSYWCKNDSILTFPYSIFAQDKKAFYLENLNTIMPIALKEGDDIFEAVCTEIGLSTEMAVESCYPKFISNTIIEKVMAQELQASVDNTFKGNDSSIGNITQLKLNDVLSPEKKQQLIRNTIDDVLIELIGYVHDPIHLEVFFDYNCCIALPDTISITHEAFCTDIIEIMTSELNCDFIEYIFDNKPKKLQQILLKLRYNIWKQVNLEEKMVELYRYLIFVHLVFEKTTEKSLKTCNFFLLRDVIYTNITVIKYEQQIMQSLSMKYLLRFLTMVIPKLGKYVAEFVLVISSCLVPHAIQGNRDALKVLEVIAFSNNALIKEQLQFLDPLPENNQHVASLRLKLMEFRPINSTLADEIRLFLVGRQAQDSRSEGLKVLRKKFKNDLKGLSNIYLELHEMGGCLSGDSILHSLISTLVELVKSDDQVEAMEAVKCLGVLGANDLTTMVLKSEDFIQTKDCSTTLFLTKILELLAKHFVDKDLETVLQVSEALCAVLSTKVGHTVVKSDTFKTMLGFFIPFLSRGGKDASLLAISQKLYKDTLCDPELWCPGEGSHEYWIKNLVTKILDGFVHNIMKCLIPIVNKMVSFAEELLPFLLNLLMDASPRVKELVGSRFVTFFDRHWSASASLQKQSIAMNISSIRCILNSLHFIRLQRLHDKKGRYQDLEMNLDYLKVAKAAVYCSAYFSAVMYAEKSYHVAVTNAKCKTASYNLSPIGLLDEIGEETTQLRLILTQAYKGIDDNYALFGGHLEPCSPSTSLLNLDFKNDFELLNYDMQLGLDNTVAWKKLGQCFRQYGLYNLAITHSQGQQDFPDAYYDCMWRLGQWDELDQHVKSSSGTIHSFESNIYKLLNAMNDNDQNVFHTLMKNTRLEIIETMKSVSLESCKTLYGQLSKLERLQELEDIFTTVEKKGDLNALIKGFKIRDKIDSDMMYWEPRIAQRIEAINTIPTREMLGTNTNYIDLSLDYANLLCKHDNMHIPKRTLNKFRDLEDPELKARIDLLDARIDWALGHNSGISKLQKLIELYKPETSLRATILKLCGEWMTENKSENSQNILTKYFVPSADILTRLNSSEQHCYLRETEEVHEVYKALAKFADEEYQHVCGIIKSPEFIRKEESMNKMIQSAKKLRTVTSTISKDVQKAIITYERMTKIDEIDIKNTYGQRVNFLKVAIQYYLHNLKYSTKVQTEIFRLFSLWLENKTNTEIITIIEEKLSQLEIYKILPILPQLVPHISNEEDRFSKCISTLIENCAIQHPHHSLPLVISVANTNKDDNFTKDNARTTSNESRIRGAQQLIIRLNRIPEIKQIMTQYNEMASAFIELAYFSPEVQRGESAKIPRTLKIYNIRDYTSVLMPTYNLPYSCSNNYNNIVGVHKFKQEFVSMGGINMPKRLECIGTDGIMRYLLVKGQDDIRQDAVMQQVFGIMNELLNANKETQNFKIRTYKVIPLSKRSGVLEWVKNSMPIGEYLLDAHRLYYPKDQKTDSAKQIIKEGVGKGLEYRIKAYLGICERIHPVFHKFFETNFLEPTSWYERRRAYTQSVATSSMCGYVLGIGDRHVQNILVDTNTAEVVHIDFGIAFEQGKILPTPETVPFRLTRDIVDGMGICGIEGTFRKTCEKTMEALRRNAITIQTIVEVLLYDPLYDWSITPNRAYSKQFDEGTDQHSPLFSPQDRASTNVAAERALGRLKQKLLGNDLSGKTTKVSTQVDLLIKQAREPANLSRLFYGWQAYL